MLQLYVWTWEIAVMSGAVPWRIASADETVLLPTGVAVLITIFT